MTQYPTSADLVFICAYFGRNTVKGIYEMEVISEWYHTVEEWLYDHCR